MPTVILISNSTQKALTTLYRQKLFMNIPGDRYDQRLTMLINNVTGFIERYCRRSLLYQTFTNEVYDGTGHRTLILKQFPVASVSSFQYRKSNDETDDWGTFNATSDYHVFSDGRVTLINGATVEVPRKYRLTYIAGYKIDFDQENTPASHTLPPELEYACQKLVSALFNTGPAEGMEDSSIGDSSVTLRQKLFSDPEVRAILDKYAAPII